MSKVVVLFSGGVDSMVLATMAERAGTIHSCLHYQYGQSNAEMEMIAMSAWCRARNVPRVIMALPLSARSMAIGTGAPGARVVPGRNLAMLAVGISYAASVGASEVWYGANADDHGDYADCRPMFVSALSMLAENDTGVAVRAPLLWQTKAQIVVEARRIGADIGAAWTCYEPTRNGEPCGTCNACVLRVAAGA